MNDIRRPSPTALALALFLATPALAQDDGSAAAQEAPRQHRDVSFAAELGFGREWYDLAYAVLDAMESSRKAPPPALDQAKLLRAQLMTKEAGTLRDPAKREEKLKAARAIFEELGKKGGAAATEAALQIGEMFITEGDSAFQRMKGTEDPEARAAARTEADEKYKAAEKYFADLVAKYEDAAEGDQLYKLMVARFSRARALFQMAQMLDKGMKERDALLEKAAAAFEEVNFEHGDQVMGYEAAIWLGLARKDLGQIDKAIAAYTSATALKDWFLGEDGKYHFPDPGMAEIVARAFFFKAQTLNEAKAHQKASDTVKLLFEIMPSYQRENLGLAARCEDAKARIALGDSKKGMEIAKSVVDDDPKGPWGATAKDILTGRTGTGGAGLPPDRRMANAEAAIDRGRSAEGLNGFRTLIADLEAQGGDDAAKWLPLAWYKMGNAYFQMRRFDEATAIFDALAARFKTSELAPKALFLQSLCLSSVNAAKPNPFDDGRYEATLKRLASEYPNDVSAKASGYLLGNRAFESRDYPKAAEQFEKVTEAAGEYYDASLYQAGVAYAMEGRRLAQEKDAAKAKLVFSSARAAFEKAIKWGDGGAVDAGKVAAESERAGNLKKMAFRARCRLAEVYLHPVVKDGSKALAVAEEAEKALGEQGDPEMLADARLLIVQAHLAAGDLDRAEAAQEKLAAGAPESPRNARGERELAIALDQAAEDARKKAGNKATDEMKKLLARAAEHYGRWVVAARAAELPVPATDYVKAGDRLYAMAFELNGIPETASFADVDDLAKLPATNRFEQAGVAYDAALQSGLAGDQAWLTKVKLSSCLGFIGRFDASAKAFEPLIASEKILREEKGDEGKTYFVIDPAAVKGQRSILLFAYADYARALFEAAKTDRKRLDEVLDIYARVITVTPPDTQLWWRAKYEYFAALYEKGDYQNAMVGMRAMQRTNPTFDRGRYGVQAKFEALAKKLESKQPPAKGGGK